MQVLCKFIQYKTHLPEFIYQVENDVHVLKFYYDNVNAERSMLVCRLDVVSAFTKCM